MTKQSECVINITFTDTEDSCEEHPAGDAELLFIKVYTHDCSESFSLIIPLLQTGCEVTPS